MRASVKRGEIKLTPDNALESAELADLYKNGCEIRLTLHGYPQEPGKFPFNSGDAINSIQLFIKPKTQNENATNQQS